MTEKGEENAFNGFYQHTDSVYSVDLSEDGFKAISGGGDDLAYLWKCDVRSSEPLEFKALTGHSDSVISVSFNVDFSKILTASMDGTIRVYSVSDGTFLKSLDGPSKEINWIKVHKNYDYVLSGSADGTCWTFNLSDLENPFMSAFARHLKSVSCGDFCDFEGTNAITASDDGQIFQWNYGDGSFERYLPNLNSQITNVSISSQIIIASTVNGSCVVISLKSGNIAFQLDCGTTSVESASLCNFDKFVFATSLDGSLGVWDISTKRKRFKLNLKVFKIILEWNHCSQSIGYKTFNRLRVR
ncbi:60S ribosomal subunit assembly or modification protein [Bonamia ostreae]|uniref:60S ribosomal subunit assembly or modification protein n=1 Tax=Bonamia ostreae TaxID=126728 RepID=A0ABV2AQ18_9EUKA